MREKDMNQQIAEHIMTEVNHFCNTEKIAEYMSREHRTLQQTFTKLCVDWLKQLAVTEYYDERNKASVELAKSLMDIPEAKEVLDTARLPMI